MTDFDHKLNKSAQLRIVAEAARRQNQQQFLSESRRPQEGPYYWVPNPNGQWEVMSYYVEQLGHDNTDHVRVWRDSTAHYLSGLWGVAVEKLRPYPYGVPRGRVSKGSRSYYINHGGDAPVPEWERLIRREFNLSPAIPVKALVDDHERIQKRDHLRLWSALREVNSVACDKLLTAKD